VVVLIVMGGAVVLFGAVLLVGGRTGAPSAAAEALGVDVGPASTALLLAVGIAMIGLGAYPLVAPWRPDGATAVASTPGAPPTVSIVELGVTLPTAAPTTPPAGR
jgi:hypothetical protein